MIIKNDWKYLAEHVVPDLNGSMVSVVVPAKCTQQQLDYCVAALIQQDLPPNSFEVIVVDHGSEIPLQLKQNQRGFRITRLEAGFGPGAARAYGAKQAIGDILVFLDVDIIALPDTVREYATLCALDPAVLVTGFRDFIDPLRIEPTAMLGAISSRTLDEFMAPHAASEGQEWIDAFLAKCEDGTAWRDDLFVTIVGAGLGVSRRLYDLCGGFTDHPVHGVEDTEFGWRAFQAGAVIAANHQCRSFHLGLRSISRNREAINRRRAGHLANLIPHKRYRPRSPRQSWTVPRFLVQLEVTGETTPENAIDTVRDLLNAEESDVIIQIVDIESVPEHEIVRSWFEADPRIQFVSQSQTGIPLSTPFILRTIAGVRFGPSSLKKMVAALSDDRIGLASVVSGSDLVTAQMWRTCALSRAAYFRSNEASLRTAVREGFGELWVGGDEVSVSHPEPIRNVRQEID